MWAPSLPNLFTQPLGCHCTVLHFRSTCSKTCFLPSAKHLPSSPSDPQKSVGIYLCLCEAPGWISGNTPSTGSPSSLCINCQLTHDCRPGGAIRGTPPRGTHRLPVPHQVHIRVQLLVSRVAWDHGTSLTRALGPRVTRVPATEGSLACTICGGIYLLFFQEKLDRQFAGRTEDNCLLCGELWGRCCRGYVKCPGLAPCSQPGGVSADGTHLCMEPRKPRMLRRVHLMKLTPKRLVTR